jgi:hypothetical protein
MAHFAKIEDGIVTQVIVVDNAHETDGQDYLNGIGLTGTWVQTSYNATFGKRFAGVGDTYNNRTKEFKPAQPFASWKFNSTLWAWESPTPHPNDGEHYLWNEDTKAWVKP